MGEGSNAFVVSALCNLVNGAWCGKDWLVVCVVEGIFEFVDCVFRVIGFLCED